LLAGETILVVDDDDDIREIITLYLENEGFHVVTAFDGNQALAYANTVNPDLIILDMMLPDLDGIEVCQELRKSKSMPIIFLSCKSTPTDKFVFSFMFSLQRNYQNIKSRNASNSKLQRLRCFFL